MFRVTREIKFCYGHRLLHYDGRCQYLHGHNGRAIVTMEGPELDARGLLTDFGDIKRTIGEWVDRHLDHHMVLHREDPLAGVLKRHGQMVLELDVNPTAENLARLLFDVGAEAGFPISEVQFWETDSSFATFAALRAEQPTCEFANGVYRGESIR